MHGKKKLLVAAGGSGGHIFPGLTVARHLMARGWKVRWIGTVDGMERRLVSRYGIKVDPVGISSVGGRFLRVRLSALLRGLWRFPRVCRIVGSWRPDVVLGMGGCASVSGVVAAWRYQVPVVLHEQNAVAGISNRWLLRIASRSLQAYPGSLPSAETVGNPVRDSILSLSPFRDRSLRRSGPIRILVMGGSKGAHIFNRVIPTVAASMAGSAVFLHQTGESPVGLRPAGSWHRVTRFIEDVASAYSWADLVICRSGALTVSEVAAAGLPAVFVPFEHADRHQEKNALSLVRSGAAVLIRQSELTVDGLVELLRSLGRRKLAEMADSHPQERRLDATRRVAEEIESLVGRSPWSLC